MFEIHCQDDTCFNVYESMTADFYCKICGSQHVDSIDLIEKERIEKERARDKAERVK
jgi:hypothetical protein